METEQKQIPKKGEFNVKLKGTDKGVYHGTAWLNTNEYGPYLTIKVRQPIPEGATVYVSPRQGVKLKIDLKDERPQQTVENVQTEPLPKYELNKNTQRYKDEQQKKEDAKAFV